MIKIETLTINNQEFKHIYSDTASVQRGDIIYNDIYVPASLAGEDDDYIEIATGSDELITSDFWEAFQWGGRRTDYSYAFSNWNHNKVVPKHPLNCDKLTYLLLNSKIVDASNVIVNCLASNPNLMGVCMNCELLVSPPTLNFPVAPFVRTWTNAFAGCIRLKSCIIDFGNETLSETNPISNRNNMQNCFFNCVQLQSIRFRGKGSPKSLDLSQCKQLDTKTMVNLSEHLYDVSNAQSGDYTIKVSAETMASLNSEIIETFEALGWDLLEV